MGDTLVLLDWREDKSEGGVTECIGLLGKPSLIRRMLARHYDGYEIRFSRYICAAPILPWWLSAIYVVVVVLINTLLAHTRSRGGQGVIGHDVVLV